MMMAVRLSEFAFSVHDWVLYLQVQRKAPTGSEIQVLSDRQLKYCIRQYPSLIQFFAWHFFLPGVVATAFEYTDYNNFVERREFNDIPLHLWPPVKKILLSFVLLGVVAVFGNAYGVEGLSDYIIVHGDEHPLIYKFINSLALLMFLQGFSIASCMLYSAFSLLLCVDFL